VVCRSIRSSFLSLEQVSHQAYLVQSRSYSWFCRGGTSPNRGSIACSAEGETRNALTRAVFFNRLGELRDRTYENQQHRASGLNLVVAAIALWNTVYLERAISALQERSYVFDQKLLVHLSPLKWEHINLTGDYHWRRDGGLRNRKLRPLRSQPLPDFAS
jgi:Tn3 transposase DDE domain